MLGYDEDLEMIITLFKPSSITPRTGSPSLGHHWAQAFTSLESPHQVSNHLYSSKQWQEFGTDELERYPEFDLRGWDGIGPRYATI
jgi:hypothetical protein